VPFKKELAVVDIVVTARAGVDGTSMPAFGASFSVEELHDVASYIGKEILPPR
jgi:mono/diheme cytochrome c family protein